MKVSAQTRIKLIAAAVLVSALVLSVATSTSSATPRRTETVSSQEAVMVELTNDYRSNRGLAAPQIDNDLMASAQEKADTLCSSGDWSHDAGGEKFNAAIDRTDYSYRLAGENLAKGYADASRALSGFIDSPTHLDNLVGDWTDIGVGYSECGGKHYYAVHYGDRR